MKFKNFDDQETTRPTLVQKAGVDLDFVLNTQLITVDWSMYFDATDTLGGSMNYDISSAIKIIDYGTLDNTVVGSYDITLSVSDYAGNETTLVVTINIIEE